MAEWGRLRRRRVLTLAVAMLGWGFVPVESDGSANDSREDDGAFGITPPIACREIRGFEEYEALPRAELTSDEKLLVYFTPRHYKSEKVGKKFAAHFVQEGRIRRRGEKAVIWAKPKILDYTATADTPPQLIYLRNTISLKILKPGDYDYDIILVDKIGRSEPAVRTLPFTVVPQAEKAEAPKGKSKLLRHD